MVVIRKAKSSDIPILINMWREFQKHHNNCITDKDCKRYFRKKIDADKVMADTFKYQINSPKRSILLALENERPVGYVVAGIDRTFEIFKLEKIGELKQLFVKTHYRGKGIGTKLYTEASEWVKSKGAKDIKLKVYAFNALGRKVYKKIGFSEYDLELRKRL